MTSIQTISQCLGNSGAKCMRQCLSNRVVSKCSELWRSLRITKTDICLSACDFEITGCVYAERKEIS